MTKERQEILRLEGIVENQRQQLEGQAVELASVGRAAFEVRKEDVEQLTDYKETNSSLIEFADKIAKSKSKFAKEARRLLGYES
jgi:hypothetical protein